MTYQMALFAIIPDGDKLFGGGWIKQQYGVRRLACALVAEACFGEQAKQASLCESGGKPPQSIIILKSLGLSSLPARPPLAMTATNSSVAGELYR
jgi:hypothetical protein